MKGSDAQVIYEIVSFEKCVTQIEPVSVCLDEYGNTCNVYGSGQSCNRNSCECLKGYKNSICDHCIEGYFPIAGNNSIVDPFGRGVECKGNISDAIKSDYSNLFFIHSMS